VSDHTPTTHEVREAYTRSVLISSPEMRRDRMAQFDRWLDAHDREIRIATWDEGYAHGVTDEGISANPYEDDEA
jgi:hypothetical protein